MIKKGMVMDSQLMLLTVQSAVIVHDKTQTGILAVVFPTTMLVMLTAPFIFATVDGNNDWPNALTLEV